MQRFSNVNELSIFLSFFSDSAKAAAFFIPNSVSKL